MCYICGDGGELILCDGGCNRAYHLECLELKSIPQDDKWLCPYCELKKQHASDPPVTYVDATEENDEDEEKDEEEEQDEDYGAKKKVKRRSQKKTKKTKAKEPRKESVPVEGSDHPELTDREQESNEEPEIEQPETQAPVDSDESVHEEDVREEEEEDPSAVIKALASSRYRHTRYDEDEPYLQHPSKTRKRRSPEVTTSTSHASREPFICPVIGCECISENRTSMLSHAYRLKISLICRRAYHPDMYPDIARSIGCNL